MNGHLKIFFLLLWLQVTIPFQGISKSLSPLDISDID